MNKMVSKTGPYKKPAKERFSPEVVIGVMLLNEKYGKTSHKNLENVVGDETRVRALFEFLGIPKTNIFYLKDGTLDEVEMLYARLKLKYLEANNNGPKTLFIIWYGGHGEMNGTATTHISLNEADEALRCYPWEINLNHLSNAKNTYTLAFFDCCRVQLSEKEWILKLQKKQEDGRGKESEIVCEAVPGQLKIFFGCRAGSTTPKESNLSHAVLDEFKRQLAVYGYVKTCNHQVLNTKLPTNMKMDTRDNTSMSLYWVFEGT